MLHARRVSLAGEMPMCGDGGDKRVARRIVIWRGDEESGIRLTGRKRECDAAGFQELGAFAERQDALPWRYYP